MTDSTRLVKIGAAARLMGVSPQTLRDWERRGEIAPARKSGAGVRFYRLADLYEARGEAPPEDAAPGASDLTALVSDFLSDQWDDGAERDRSTLYPAFGEWAAANGREAPSAQALYAELRTRFGMRERRSQGARIVSLHGCKGRSEIPASTAGQPAPGVVEEPRRYERLVSASQAARIFGIYLHALQAWEEFRRLKPVQTARPGKWYRLADLYEAACRQLEDEWDRLKIENSRLRGESERAEEMRIRAEAAEERLARAEADAAAMRKRAERAESAAGDADRETPAAVDAPLFP